MISCFHRRSVLILFQLQAILFNPDPTYRHIFSSFLFPLPCFFLSLIHFPLGVDVPCRFHTIPDISLVQGSKSESRYDRRCLPVLVWIPIWGSWPNFNYCWIVTVLSKWDTLFIERTGLSFVAVTFSGPRRKSKGKVVPVLNELSTTLCRRLGEWMYRSTFSLSAGGEWSASSAGRFTSGERAPDNHGVGVNGISRSVNTTTDSTAAEKQHHYHHGELCICIPYT
jgi:hypothetical protein